MASPSPIHRDPDQDGDDFGCVGRNAGKANAAIGVFVVEAVRLLEADEFTEGDELVRSGRQGLCFVHADLGEKRRHDGLSAAGPEGRRQDARSKEC